jgi:DNA-binding CsgD family transcriptional regulator
MLKERIIIGIFFATIGLFTLFDVFEDIKEGADWQHLSIEIGMAAASLAAFLYLLYRIYQAHLKLKRMEEEKSILKDIAEGHQQKSKLFIEGLSIQIDREFEGWKLSQAEREIALFLLKGLSTQEISGIRGSSEKTVGHQTTSIYKKAQLKGRKELQAFFLEDLLAPQREA